MPLFLPCFWGVELCPTAIFLGAFCPTPFEALCPTLLSWYHQTAYVHTPRGIMPHPYCGILPRRSIMPQCFLPIYFFLAHFRFFGTLLARFFYFWHAINPYHQRSYKVPQYRRCKSLVSKELRRAGRGFLVVSRCHIRIYAWYRRSAFALP